MAEGAPQPPAYHPFHFDIDRFHFSINRVSVSQHETALLIFSKIQLLMAAT
jgi:hypothetical protein